MNDEMTCVEMYLMTICPQNGPTYRCLYPTPPPPETVTNCSDGGVLGVIPGVIGTLQVTNHNQLYKENTIFLQFSSCLKKT